MEKKVASHRVVVSLSFVFSFAILCLSFAGRADATQSWVEEWGEAGVAHPRHQMQLGPEMDPNGQRMLRLSCLGPEMDPNGNLVRQQGRLGPEMDPNGQRSLKLARLGPEMDPNGQLGAGCRGLGPEMDPNGLLPTR